MRETESLLIAAQNNAIRTNYVNTKIDKAQPNSKGTLCDHRDETINHIISDCNKQAQKEYKSIRDLVEKVIYWELCKKMKFDNTTKGYINKPISDA